MAATGLNPFDDDEKPKSVRVSPELLAEFDRLMKSGSVGAVVGQLRREEESRER